MSAQKVEPGDGLEWKKDKDQNGNDIDTQILQIRIDSTEADSPKPGKWPVKLSVSPEGLKGELDLTVDTAVHELGGGASVGLSNATAGVLSLVVTPGNAAEELSFRAPLRKMGSMLCLIMSRILTPCRTARLLPCMTGMDSLILRSIRPTRPAAGTEP